MVKKTANWLLIFIISTLVIIATLIMIARFSLPKISAYPAEISQYLSEQLNVDLNIESIEATWVQSKPQFKLIDVSVVDPNNKQRSISVASVLAELDIIQSIINRAPIFKHLTIDAMVIAAEQKESRWLTVFSPSASSTVTTSSDKKILKDNQGINKLLHTLLNQSKVIFSDAQLVLAPQNRPVRTVGPIQFVLQNTQDVHQLSGSAALKYYGERSKVDFAIESGATATPVTNTTFNIYAKFSNISEQLLALNLWDLGVDIEKLSMDAQVWGRFEKGLLFDVVGSAAINTLQFTNPKYPKISDSSTHFSLQDNNGKIELSLLDFRLSDGVDHIQIPALSAIYQSTAEYRGLTQLGISRLNLKQVSEQLLKQGAVSKKLKTVVQALNLTGGVNNLLLKWSSANLADFKLVADLDNVAADSYLGAPSASGVSGLLTMSALTGHVDINAVDVSLSFPKLFTKPWGYDTAKGKVSWEIERSEKGLKKVFVSSALMSVKRGSMQANGRFSLIVPLDKTKQGELLLMLGMRDSNIADVLSYIPPKIVGDSLNDWLLSAALAGEMKEAGFILRSPLRKNASETFKPSVQLYLDLADSKVNFDTKWPNYQANDLAISFMDGDLKVTSQQGSIAKNTVEQLSIEKKSTALFLDVTLGLKGDLKQLYSKLKTKPAIKQLPVPMQHWQLAGQHTSSLAITVPLKPSKRQKTLNLTTKPFYLKLESQLKNGVLVDDKLNINASKISAKLAYDSVTGLQSNKVNLTAFGYPAKLSIVSKTTDKLLKTSIALSGEIEVKAVSSWLKSDFLTKLQGRTNFDARFDFCPKSPACTQLVVNSGLLGVSIDLPKPWGKSKAQTSKFQLVNSIKNKRTIWRYNYADKIRGVTQLTSVNKKGQSLKNTVTNITLGGQRPSLSVEPGVHVSGTLDGVQLDAMMPYLALADGSGNNKAVEKNVASQNFTLKSVNLALNNARFNQQQIKFASINMQKANNHWRGSFNTALGKGEFLIPDQKHQPVKLTFNTLLYTPSAADKKATIVIKESATGQRNGEMQPENWPKVDLTIEQLVLKDRNIGRWSAQLAPTKQGYKASNILAVIGETKVTGALSFAHEQSTVRSFLELNVKGGNFGDLLAQLGYSKVLENKSGLINTNLSWRGYPWQIAQKNLNGRLNFSMKKGRIIEAGNSANFLRIFGILNLNTVIKRLQLDFSDLLQSGITFDTVTAKYYLQDGIASSEEPLKLEGSSASVEMSGTINLAEQSLEQNMQVAIPLTSNAPLAALLLATPQIAGIAFVVDKLLGKQLSKLTALRYQVSGSWLDPKISPVKAKSKKRQ
ncbi:MAG: hypothetical protein HRU06_18140 [Oceanospirillaceae bacterium]|nr:hypothetical protein [Oceanospirillaceae bacterium]